MFNKEISRLVGQWDFLSCQDVISSEARREYMFELSCSDSTHLLPDDTKSCLDHSSVDRGLASTPHLSLDL